MGQSSQTQKAPEPSAEKFELQVDENAGGVELGSAKKPDAEKDVKEEAKGEEEEEYGYETDEETIKLREYVKKLEAKMEDEKKFLSSAKEICKSFQVENTELKE